MPELLYLHTKLGYDGYFLGVDRSLATRVISTAGQGFAAAAAAHESVGQPRGDGPMADWLGPGRLSDRAGRHKPIIIISLQILS